MARRSCHILSPSTRTPAGLPSATFDSHNVLAFTRDFTFSCIQSGLIWSAKGQPTSGLYICHLQDIWFPRRMGRGFFPRFQGRSEVSSEDFHIWESLKITESSISAKGVIHNRSSWGVRKMVDIQNIRTLLNSSPAQGPLNFSRFTGWLQHQQIFQFPHKNIGLFEKMFLSLQIPYSIFIKICTYPLLIKHFFLENPPFRCFFPSVFPISI